MSIAQSRSPSFNVLVSCSFVLFRRSLKALTVPVFDLVVVVSVPVIPQASPIDGTLKLSNIFCPTGLLLSIDFASLVVLWRRKIIVLFVAFEQRKPALLSICVHMVNRSRTRL